MDACSGPTTMHASRIPESASALSRKSRNGRPIGIIAFIPASTASCCVLSRFADASASLILLPSPRARITALFTLFCFSTMASGPRRARRMQSSLVTRQRGALSYVAFPTEAFVFFQVEDETHAPQVPTRENRIAEQHDGTFDCAPCASGMDAGLVSWRFSGSTRAGRAPFDPHRKRTVRARRATLSNHLRRNALCPHPARILARPSSQGARHGAEHDIDICLLEPARAETGRLRFWRPA